MPRDIIRHDAQSLNAKYSAIRQRFLAWIDGLSAEDLCVQTMCDVSPGKWHLAHTSWFWETFLLKVAIPDYQVFDKRFCYLFNSYYDGIGERYARPERGFLTRPSLEDVLAYRRHIDLAVTHWLDNAQPVDVEQYRPVLELGFAHEEQHQELFLSDIKHVFSVNAYLEPVFACKREKPQCELKASKVQPSWVKFDGGLHTFGHNHCGFAFDNEGPEHCAYLRPFALAQKPVTNGEYLAFMEEAGYQNPKFWLSQGWEHVQADQRQAPFYWRATEQGWCEYTLHGLRPINPSAPVSHIDYYEASAFAQWAGYRLPDELEWEYAARAYDPAASSWAEPGGELHPEPVSGEGPLLGLFGGVWEWTRSAYSPYPGFGPVDDTIGEYNGKFMCGQYVLRGGSCLSPPDHIRASYRNFFPPNAQWQMSGLRLACDL